MNYLPEVAAVGAAAVIPTVVTKIGAVVGSAALANYITYFGLHEVNT